MKKCLILTIFIFQLSVAFSGEVQWIKSGLRGSLNFPELNELSPDRKYFAYADQYRDIWVVNVETGHLKTVVPKMTYPYPSKTFAFTSDSKSMVYSADQQYFVFDIETNKTIKSIEISGFLEYIYTLPNMKMLIVTSGSNYNFHIWDLVSNSITVTKQHKKQELKLNSNIRPIQTNMFTNQIVLATFDRDIIILDANNLNELQSWKIESGALMLNISDGGKYIAVRTLYKSEYHILLYDSNTFELKHKIKSENLSMPFMVRDIGFMNNDNTMIYPSGSDLINIVDINNPENVTQLQHNHRYPVAHIWSIDNEHFLTVDYDKATTNKMNVKTGEIIPFNDFNMIYNLHFSYDDKYIGALEDTGYLKLFETESGNEVKRSMLTFSHPPQMGNPPNDEMTKFIWLEFAPDKYEMIYATSNYDLVLRNYLTDDVVAVLKGHKDTVLVGRYSSDGKYFISVGVDNTVKVWDLESQSLYFDYVHDKPIDFAVLTSNPNEILIAQFNDFRDISVLTIDMNTKEIVDVIYDSIKGGSEWRKKSYAISSDYQYLLMEFEPKIFNATKPEFVYLKDKSSKQITNFLYHVEFGKNNAFLIGIRYLNPNGILFSWDMNGNQLNEYNITGKNMGEVFHASQFAISNNEKYIACWYSFNFLVLYKVPEPISVQDDFLHTLNDINLYPNPATEHINIEITNDEEVISVNVYNLLGELVWQSNNFAYSKNINIPVKELSSGMYIFKLTTTKQTYSKYFVKHK